MDILHVLHMYVFGLIYVSSVILVHSQEPSRILIVKDGPLKYTDASSSCNKTYGGRLATFTEYNSACIATNRAASTALNITYWIRDSQCVIQGRRRRRRRDPKECCSMNVQSNKTTETKTKCNDMLPYICFVDTLPSDVGTVDICPSRTASSLSTSLRTTLSTSLTTRTETQHSSNSDTTAQTQTASRLSSTVIPENATSSSIKIQDKGGIIGVTLTCIFLTAVFAMLALLAFKRKAYLPNLKTVFHNQNYTTDENILAVANENSDYFCLEKSVYAEITDPIGEEETITSSNLSPSNEGELSNETTAPLEDRTYHHLRENDRPTDPSPNYSAHTFEMSPGEYTHTSEVSPAAAQIMTNDEYTHIDVDPDGR